MSPLNPEAPPPILPKRVIANVRTAAHKNHNGLLMLAFGGAMGGTVAATSGSLGLATAAALTFLFGAFVQNLATGGK